MSEPLAEDVAFLEHYGVKGMRWGVRRSNRSKKRSGSTPKKRRAPSAKTLSNRAKRLSDEDLKDRISRMELEKKYIDLSRNTTGAGKKYTRELIESAGKTAAGGAVGAVTAHYINQKLKGRNKD